jgi:hypothetical protein
MLRERERWLLVFDNAEDPEDVARWLPGGAGHVLITSRAHGWDELAFPVEVDVMDRGESVALLRRRVSGLNEADAGLVAQAVGDLPLAVAQAAGYMAPSGIRAADYVRLADERAVEILDKGRPATYPLSLAAVTQLALDRLEAADPAAAVAGDSLAWGQSLGRISGQALARIDSQGLLTHRLTQAIIRTRLSAGEAAAARAQAATLLTASHPGSRDLPSTWPSWARLLPHLLALDPDAKTEALGDLTHDAIAYLIRCGLARNAHKLARQLHRHRLAEHGSDHPYTLGAVTALAAVLREMGHHAEARELDEFALTCFRLDSARDLNVDLDK